MISLDHLLELPPTLNSEEAAEVLGVSVWTLRSLARQGEAPIEPLRLGSTLRWPTCRLLEVLGVPLGADAKQALGGGSEGLLQMATARDDDGRTAG